MRKDTRPPLRLPLLTALACVALGGAGCSTPGPNHAYLGSRAENPIIDRLPGAPDAPISTFLNEVSELYGIAYDPFTDHLFLRVLPGNYVRVIDRPAGKIKRSFSVPGLTPGAGDLAIRSIDRHLFFVQPDRPELLETNLTGHTVRTITLEGMQGVPRGVAYDQKRDRLLILQDGPRACITTYDLAGKPVGSITLDRGVRPTSLAFDSVANEFYVPLSDQPAVGVFNLQGRFLRHVDTASGQSHDYVDVGPRSLIRMF